MAKARDTIAESENVLIHSGECAITILPRFGGKIASIRVGQHELLQVPLAPVAPRTRTMTFDEGDASGWDECLPSVAACSIETAAGTAVIPDHGDLWRVDWDKQDAGDSGKEQTSSSGNPVTLVGRCFSLPLELERTIELAETAQGWRLDLAYRLHNDGKYSVPWSWAAHPLFVTETGDRLVLPKSIRSLMLEGSGGGRLGQSGDSVSWPLAKLTDGGTADLSVAGPAESEIGDKLFAGPLSRADNWCALERFSVGLRIRVRFDTAATPYLGLWVCYGGWPERSGPKQVCVAMEPSTAPVDSLAVRGQWSRELGPHESFSWPMQIEIERIET
jgi:galactose mutarotase-like enzyme